MERQPAQEQKNFPSSKKFLNSAKLPLIMAAVVVILAVGGILLLRLAQTPQLILSPQPYSVSQKPAQWKTYHNTIYNFSIDYPATWTIEHYPSSSPAEIADLILFEKFDERTVEPTRQMTTIGVLANSNEDALSLKEFILAGRASIDYPKIIDFVNPEAELEYRKERVQKMTETTFQDFEALQDGKNRLFVNTGATVFLFYLHSLEDISVEDREIYNKILSTFRFID